MLADVCVDISPGSRFHGLSTTNGGVEALATL